MIALSKTATNLETLKAEVGQGPPHPTRASPSHRHPNPFVRQLMNLMVEPVSRAWVRDNILTEYHIHDLDTCSWSHKPQLHVALFCCGCYTQMTTIAEVCLHLPQFLYHTVINMLCDWHTLARNKNCDCLGRNAVFLGPGHKIIQCFDPQHLSYIDAFWISSEEILLFRVYVYWKTIAHV